MAGQDGSSRAAGGHTGDQRSQCGSRVEAHEEGEITNAERLVENTTGVEEDRVMDMDEIRAVFLEHGIDMDAADDLQDGSNGEFEKAVLELEQENGENAHKVTEDGELMKRQGTRKRLFKTTTGTAVSTKMRIASALVSPCKRGANKPGARHGEMSKQMENKGTSNPKTGPQKP
ncbi:hypothetical protein Bca52824_046929 [Brassica carinata]|uniref:Uncharacterized protein n=1 Tax=Brassica carinata TaxID=52824 RepID=A0A8X7UPI0_BRACI|nr:hypothetical protein Bca52824_046929 [Brassica carinata]